MPIRVLDWRAECADGQREMAKGDARQLRGRSLDGPTNPFAGSIGIEADFLQLLVQRLHIVSQAACMAGTRNRVLHLFWPSTFLKTVKNYHQILRGLDPNLANNLAIQPEFAQILVPLQLYW